MSNLQKSIRVKDQFPQFFDFEESSLQKFIEYYYQWLESENGPDYFSRRIPLYNDVDFKKDGYTKFDQFLRNEFLADIPSNLKVDDRLLLKSIRDFYKAKGTEDGISLLFRIVFDEDVEFDYPGKYMLRASDGKWVVETTLSLVLIVDGPEEISSFDFVVGTISGASAKIQRVEQRLENSVLKTDMYITNMFGEFQIGEVLKSKNTNNDIAILVSPGVVNHPGKYTSTDGFLSWDRKLQDNYYYQEFSYVIKSARDTKEYSTFLKKLSHPAGSLFFGEYNLRIYLDNTLNNQSMERLFSKQLSYVIPFQDYISLSLESNVYQGSFAGKYIFVYELVTFDWASVINNIVSDGGTGSFVNYTITSSNLVGVQAGDTIEVKEPVTQKILYRKVKSVLSPTQFLTFFAWPYLTTTGLQFKLYKESDENAAAIQAEHNSDDIMTGTQTTKVAAFMTLRDVRDVKISECAHLTIDDINDKRFLVRRLTAITPNFNLDPIARGTIAYITNNLNSLKSYHYILRKLGPTVVEMRDSYTLGTSTNTNYELINH